MRDEEKFQGFKKKLIEDNEKIRRRSKRRIW